MTSVATEATTSAETAGFDTTDTSGGTVEVLFDFYSQSCEGTWEDPTFTPIATLNCDLPPSVPNTLGGVWRFPQFNTQEFPDQANVLMLRTLPEDGGVLEGSFSFADLPAVEDATLEFDWEFVNTNGPASPGEMSFQVRILRQGGGDFTIAEAFNEAIGEFGTVSFALDSVEIGASDELYFFLVSDVHDEGQGVALYNAVITSP